MAVIDLNADMGESFGAWTIGTDASLMAYITSTNVACGWHGGDPVVMDKTVMLAKQRGVGIGVHPGYPDLMGFGRRSMAISPSDLTAYVKYQIGALYAFARSHGLEIQHFKAHGALYNQCVRDNMPLALSMAKAIRDFDPNIILLALPDSDMIRAAQEMGLKTANEAFADRAYNEDGSLVSRNRPDSMITNADVAVQRMVRMATEGKIETVTGRDIAIQCDSICIHGDGPDAPLFAQKIRAALERANVDVKPLGSFIR